MLLLYVLCDRGLSVLYVLCDQGLSVIIIIIIIIHTFLYLRKVVTSETVAEEVCGQGQWVCFMSCDQGLSVLCDQGVSVLYVLCDQGLSILLNTCNLRTADRYTEFADHVTCVSLKREEAVPVVNRRLDILCVLFV